MNQFQDPINDQLSYHEWVNEVKQEVVSIIICFKLIIDKRKEKRKMTSSSSSSLFSVESVSRLELFEPSIGAEINKPVFGSSTNKK